MEETPTRLTYSVFSRWKCVRSKLENKTYYYWITILALREVCVISVIISKKEVSVSFLLNILFRLWFIKQAYMSITHIPQFQIRYLVIRIFSISLWWQTDAEYGTKTVFIMPNSIWRPNMQKLKMFKMLLKCLLRITVGTVYLKLYKSYSSNKV